MNRVKQREEAKMTPVLTMAFFQKKKKKIQFEHNFEPN